MDALNIKKFLLLNIRDLNENVSFINIDELDGEGLDPLRKLIHKDGSFTEASGEGWKFANGLGGIGGLTITTANFIDQDFEEQCRSASVPLSHISDEIFIQFQYEDREEEDIDEEELEMAERLGMNIGTIIPDTGDDEPIDDPIEQED